MLSIFMNPLKTCDCCDNIYTATYSRSTNHHQYIFSIIFPSRFSTHSDWCIITDIEIFTNTHYSVTHHEKNMVNNLISLSRVCFASRFSWIPRISIRNIGDVLHNVLRLYRNTLDNDSKPSLIWYDVNTEICN